MLDGSIRNICTGFVLVFGFWTLLANVTVHWGLGFSDLRTLAPLGLVLTAATVAAARRFGSESREHVLESRGGPDFSIHWKTAAGLAASALLAAIFVLGHRYSIYWGLVCLFLGVAYLKHIRAPGLEPQPATPSRADVLLLVLASIVAMIATLVIHRPDPDDSLYLNMAVSVLDAPQEPMWTTDTVHGLPGGFYFPTYRVHALELLTALFADVLRLEPIEVAHLVLPPLFALLSVLAAARLFRILLRSHWAWATLALVVVLLSTRQTHWMYGNFAYVRLFQGKAVFVTLAIPLIVTYALEFFASGGFKRWALLAMAQIAAVGLTANGLYGAPLAAGLALAGCWHPSRSATRRIGLGALASFYPLLLGLWVRQEMAATMLVTEFVGEPSTLEDAVVQFLGRGGAPFAWLAALTGSWCLLADPARRRWILGCVLGFLLVFMNPLLDEFWAANLTGVHLLWRLFWTVPLPALLALVVTSSLALGRPAPSIMRAFAFAASLLLLIYVFWPPYSNPSYGGSVVGTPGLKVPLPAYRVAKVLSRLAGPHETVLAPEEISTWIPTFRGHPYPVVARQVYLLGQLRVFSAWIDPQLITERLALLRFVSGSARDPGRSLLVPSVDRLRIRAIAAPIGMRWLPELSRTLLGEGFISREYSDYLVFYRGQEWPSEIREGFR